MASVWALGEYATVVFSAAARLVEERDVGLDGGRAGETRRDGRVKSRGRVTQAKVI